MVGTIAPSIFDSSLYIPDLKVRRKESVLHEMVECAHRAGAVTSAEPLHRLLALRESLGATSPGRCIAVPAARSLVVPEPRIVVARSRRGIEWGAGDGLPVQLVFLVLSPSDCGDSVHLDLIARIAAAARPVRSRQKMLEGPGFEPIASTLRELMA